MELSPSALDAVMVALIPIGGIMCLFGYHVFKLVLALIGAVLGGGIGLFVGAGTFTEGPVVLLSAVLGAVIGAWLMLALHIVGVFVVGAVLGTIVAFSIGTGTNGDPETLTLAIAAVGGGIVALALRRLTITVTTALLGAWGVVLGAAHFAGRPVDATSLPEALLPSATDIQTVLLWWLGLAVVGIIVQYAWSAKREPRRPSATAV